MSNTTEGDEKVRRILRDVDQSIAASLPLLRDVYCEVVNGKITVNSNLMGIISIQY